MTMGQSWEKPGELTLDELKVIFEVIKNGRGQEEARKRLSARNRTTVNRACNVAAEFERRKPESLSDNEAAAIAKNAHYDATLHYVQELFLPWKAWSRREDSRPVLRILYDRRRPSDLGVYRYANGPLRKFVCVAVENLGTEIARRCLGVLAILAPESAHRPRDFKLHWADTDYTLETDTAEAVDIYPETTRRLDVAFTLPSDQEPVERSMASGEIRSLSATIGSGLSNDQPLIRAMGTAQITSGPTPCHHLGSGQLPGTYSKESTLAAAATQQGGCWIAIPIALCAPHVATQAYLKPAEYIIQVRVLCENGDGETKTFRLTSPQTWDGLTLEEIEK
jgi:hypothetical protein